MAQRALQAGPGEPAFSRGVNADVVVAVQDEHVTAGVVGLDGLDDGLGEVAGPDDRPDQVVGALQVDVHFDHCHVWSPRYSIPAPAGSSVIRSRSPACRYVLAAALSLARSRPSIIPPPVTPTS